MVSLIKILYIWYIILNPVKQKWIVSLLFHYLQVFFTPVLTSSISLESEWPRVHRILLSILANLNNAAVYMVSILPDFQFLWYFSRPYFLSKMNGVTVFKSWSEDQAILFVCLNWMHSLPFSYTRSVQKVSNHFEYLVNQSHSQ